MKNRKLFTILALAILFGGFALARGQSLASGTPSLPDQKLKEKRVIYFNPEVYPDIDEIKGPTNAAFFSAVSDKISKMENNSMLRAEVPVTFDSVNVSSIQEYCKNNNADFAIVPKVRYFKVGLGKLVFSNQVVVSMKLYDAAGNFLAESNYDTYKKNMRMIGSAENSVKIGTAGAIRMMMRNLRKKAEVQEQDRL